MPFAFSYDRGQDRVFGTATSARKFGKFRSQNSFWESNFRKLLDKLCVRHVPRCPSLGHQHMAAIVRHKQIVKADNLRGCLHDTGMSSSRFPLVALYSFT